MLQNSRINFQDQSVFLVAKLQKISQKHKLFSLFFTQKTEKIVKNATNATIMPPPQHR